MGDLNARIGLLNDNIVQDTIPNNVLCTLYCVSESLPRVSQDNTVNTYGKHLIDICVNTGLQIVNGRVGADRGIGRYTCYTYNRSSVVDYVLAQTGIRKRIVSFEVDDLQLHSDHCPILLKLNTGISYKGGEPDCANNYRGIMLLQSCFLLHWKTESRHGLPKKE